MKLVPAVAVMATVLAGEAEIGGREARPSDTFWVGSITKSFVTTVVMQLVAEHRLRLDDRVSKCYRGGFARADGSGCGTCSTTRAGSGITWSSKPGSAPSRATLAS
jgi:CubicO group peptidase (beta-lactamase class C family)